MHYIHMHEARIYQQIAPHGSATHLLSSLRSNPLGHAHGRNPSGLRTDHVTHPATALFDEVIEHQLRELRGLAAPGIA